ncbi:conserved hypothetical protein [Streptomyces pristinaespiralis ATCC 25486]|uniref:C2H2-type domain-containing protein n=1 Tax=Streptomyces pristinaespiralis (strain ATCC 25486 / DSM 40338 / CBS 914.69 / JCM 4507 / KCC S-0507 / NBRC 13074 / NRRL 2958 / 5647) TaxID=457429 RepID=B5HBG7_STRE2|nr:hypothetical protein [Streptomyces pristinaespiralis]EDY64178.2 conserved hypothetical protein [Streptomyces pristinaespiralis ATCC 25486]
MSETTGPAKVHEEYSFACMRCGHGWEQSYDIEHHVDPSGEQFVVYKSDGRRVPSPLSSPTCVNCGGHVVRIMRAGRVSTVQNLMGLAGTGSTTAAAVPVSPAGPPAAEEVPDPRADRSAGRATASATPPSGSTAEGPAAEGGTDEAAAPAAHHWHLSDLLRPFHHRK